MSTPTRVAESFPVKISLRTAWSVTWSTCATWRTE
jgi:hypothetical protein